ncbi:unnamed protein product, partial [Scytosiphon promiscuus]
PGGSAAATGGADHGAAVAEADERIRAGGAFVLLKVQWKTQTLAILHVGCFGVGPARRADVMADLRRQIWSAGGLVTTPHRGTRSGSTTSTGSGDGRRYERDE